MSTFWIGSYATPQEEGLHLYSFTEERGLEQLRAYTGLTESSFVLEHPRHPVLYTVEETMDGAICAWRIEGTELTQVSKLSTGGGAPCHLALSEDGRMLYAANYMGGSLACFALDEEGIPVKRSDLRQHEGHGPNAIRQEGPHAHFSLAKEGLQFVCDLGLDAIIAYENVNGELHEKQRIAVPAGYGPRHLAIHPNWPKHIYCLTQLASHVLVLALKEQGYEVLQDLSMLPEDNSKQSIAAAIKFTENGRFLLASNRGHDSIAVYPVNQDGTLGTPTISSCLREPRDFLILGDDVIVGSQCDSQIQVYHLDRVSGALEPAAWGTEVHKPVCFQRRTS